MSETIAKVNGKLITQRHFDDMALLYKQQTKTDKINEAEQKVIMEQIIDNFLLLEEAERREIKLGDDVIDKNIEEIKKQFGNDDNFYKELEKNNISFDTFKDNIISTLLIQKFTNDQTRDKVKITADMLENYYETHKSMMVTPEMITARHILIDKKKAGSVKKAREKALELLKKIKKGAKFEDIAKSDSDCPSSERGGDLGTFTRGKMVPEFDKTAFSLKINEISEPVETIFGIHLIKVDQRYENRAISFKEAQPYIEKIISQNKSQKIMKSLADELRKSADIEIY